MAKKWRSELDYIGNTPLQNVDGILVKLEYLNPSGSIKDRIAKYIVEKAEQKKELKKGYSIVEATSGNTGIAFSMVAAAKGYNCTIVLPKGLSVERQELILAYGSKIIFVRKNCVKCAVEKTREIARKNKNVFLPKQFENPWNAEENEKILGKEILRQFAEQFQKNKKKSSESIDAVVAGVGTGGTLIGVGKAVRKKFPRVQIIAVEPAECPLLSENRYGRHRIFGLHKGYTCKAHGIEGIGDGFIPKIVQENRNLIDEVIAVKTADAVQTARLLAKKGFFVGPSSGANFWAAQKARKKFQNVLTFFCDRGERYLSEKLF
ncbi:MAG: PLP-dependent cysteine synthase family protein [Candidatus Micrarchaeota archaeon]